jgi:LmbE family N-acetylglucosaminyl deacetylase
MTDTLSLAPLSEDWQRALAVVAHPDDLEYGAASAIARWTTQGKHVQYLLVTRGEAGIDAMEPTKVGPLREAEECRSAAIVGVNTVEFLGYADGVVEYGLPLRRAIARVIRRAQPDVLVTSNYHLSWPGGTFNMADHRWVGLAVLDAARDAANRWIFPELLAEGCMPWHGVRMVCIDASPYATHAVDVTAYIEQGIASLQAHRMYLQNLGADFDPRTFLCEQAAEVGKRCGYQYAVGFEVINI